MILARLSRRLSLRALLAVPFLFQALLLAAAIGWLSFMAGKRAVDELAQKLSADIFSRIEQTTDRQLRDSRLIVETVRAAAASGQLDTSDFAALEHYFHRLTQVTEAAPYIYFGNLRGDFIGVDRGFGQGVTTRLKSAATGGTRYAYRIAAPGDRGEPIAEQSGKFDTLTRPWYRQAMETGVPGWTPIYLSPVKRVLEMTQTAPIMDAHGKIVGAIGVDVSLGLLSQFMRGLVTTAHGVAFIMEPSGELVASSDSQDPFVKTRLAEKRMLATASDNPLVREAAVRLLDPAQGRLQAGKSSVLTYSTAGGPIQVVAKPLSDGKGLNWIIALALPQSDLTADVTSNAYRTAVACALVLGLTLTFGLAILRRIRGDIGQLTVAARKLGGGEWSQPLPTERSDEIGDLARSFSAMSGQLQNSLATVSRQNEALAHTNLMLEQKVADRTAQLSLQNLRLQDEIAERAKAELHVRRLSNVVEQTDDGILVCDAAGVIEYVNPGFEKLTGYSQADVRGKSPAVLKSSHHPPAFYAEMWRVISSGQVYRGVVQNRKKSGDIYHAAVTITPIRDAAGKIVSYISVEKDVTEREQTRERMRHQIETDRLTGVMSRAAFTDHLQAFFRHAKEEGRSFALLFMDLDGFKAVNDQHGHDVGDRVLVLVARRLRRSVRDKDAVARLGGDEFVALLTDLRNPADAERVAAKIMESVGEPIVSDDGRFSLGVSIGIAFYPDDAQDADTLLQRADYAMYTAKRRGKNIFVRYAADMTDTYAKNPAGRARAPL